LCGLGPDVGTTRSRKSWSTAARIGPTLVPPGSARSLRHLINALAELEARGIAFVSLRDNLDLGTPSGRLMFQIIGAMAEFERALISGARARWSPPCPRQGEEAGTVPL
jgi:resolvase-like protein